MVLYNSLSNDNFYGTRFSGVKKIKLPKLDEDTNKAVDKYVQNYKNMVYKSTTPSDKRGAFRTLIDLLSLPNYAVAGFAKGMVDKGEEDEINPIEGFAKGALAGITGNDEHRYSFSDVLEDAGWEPQTGVGKFAKGFTGVMLDIFLDPTTYITGGWGGIIKGTGKSSAKVLSK